MTTLPRTDEASPDPSAEEPQPAGPRRVRDTHSRLLDELVTAHRLCKADGDEDGAAATIVAINQLVDQVVGDIRRGRRK